MAWRLLVGLWLVCALWLPAPVAAGAVDTFERAFDDPTKGANTWPGKATPFENRPGGRSGGLSARARPHPNTETTSRPEAGQQRFADVRLAAERPVDRVQLSDSHTSEIDEWRFSLPECSGRKMQKLVTCPMTIQNLRDKQRSFTLGAVAGGRPAIAVLVTADGTAHRSSESAALVDTNDNLLNVLFSNQGFLAWSPLSAPRRLKLLFTVNPKVDQATRIDVETKEYADGNTSRMLARFKDVPLRWK